MRITAISVPKNGIGLLFIIGLLSACGPRSKEIVKTDLNISYSVESAPEWTQLFYRKDGWFGADGIFTIPLTGRDRQGNLGNDSTLIFFSDTYIGKVVENKPDQSSVMVNNSVAYLKGNQPIADSLDFFIYRSSTGQPSALFVPSNEHASEDDFFWLGDGFVNQELSNTLYVFAYHIERTGENVYDFIEPNVSLMAMGNRSSPPYVDQRQLTTPLHVKIDSLGEGNLGSGILVNTTWAGAPNPDGYIYVYGCIGAKKSLVVARVKPKDFENFKEWRYWNGEQWDVRSETMQQVVDAASNELSVTPLPDGRFVLIFQVLGLSDKIGMRIGASPVGPFSEIHEIYETPEMKNGLWCYNAKAHFNLSAPNELLISYNTITPNFWIDIKEDAHIYRPRFIKIKFDL
jgi:hypothetical protein